MQDWNKNSGKQYKSITRHLYTFSATIRLSLVKLEQWLKHLQWRRKERSYMSYYTTKIQPGLTDDQRLIQVFKLQKEIKFRKHNVVSVLVSVVECIHGSHSHHMLFTHGCLLPLRPPASASGPASWQSSLAFVSTVRRQTSTCMTGTRQEKGTFTQTAKTVK